MGAGEAGVIITLELSGTQAAGLPVAGLPQGRGGLHPVGCF